MLHKSLLNAALGRVSWWQFLLSDPMLFSLSGVKEAQLWKPGVSDGSEPPTLNLCGLRLDFTTKHAMWAFGMGIIQTLIHTDRQRKMSPEST